MGKKITISIVIAVIALCTYFASNFLKKMLSPAPTIKQSSVMYKKEDINKDEKIDKTDLEIVNAQLNCKKSDPCWSKVIGKTLNGDNPIYAFDLDLNNDGAIDQLDLNQVKNFE